MEQPRIFRYDTVDSTNTVCKSLAAQGAPSGTAVIARRQTAGRGRMGRSFESPEGLGLYLSVLWRPEGTPEDLLPLTPMAAVSAAMAIRRVTGAPVRIKWPNDLVLEGRKLAGILTEASLSGRGVDHVVIGIGVNLRQRPDDFSPEVAQIATSLEAQGYPADRAALETALAQSLRTLAHPGGLRRRLSPPVPEPGTDAAHPGYRGDGDGPGHRLAVRPCGAPPGRHGGHAALR